MNQSNDSNQRLVPALAQTHAIAKRSEGGILLHLHVQPGASRARIAGLINDRLKVSVTKKAIDGQANEAVRVFLAETFGLSKSQVTLLKGEKSRQKTFLLDGNETEILKKLAEILKG